MQYFLAKPLNKILGMRLMVLYKYMDCTVDKATGTSTTSMVTLLTHINYATNYSILIIF